MASARAYFDYWKTAQHKIEMDLFGSLSESHKLVQSIKAGQGRIKITVDAALFDFVGCFGIGWIARNEDGELIEGAKEVFKGVESPLIAEVIWLKEVLHMKMMSSSSSHEDSFENDFI